MEIPPDLLPILIQRNTVKKAQELYNTFPDITKERVLHLTENWNTALSSIKMIEDLNELKKMVVTTENYPEFEEKTERMKWIITQNTEIRYKDALKAHENCHKKIKEFEEVSRVTDDNIVYLRTNYETMLNNLLDRGMFIGILTDVLYWKLEVLEKRNEQLIKEIENKNKA